MRQYLPKLVIAVTLFAIAGLIFVVGRKAPTVPIVSDRQQFYDCIASGDANAVSFCLKRRPGLLTLKFGEETPLHVAARANRPEVIKVLLDNGAALDARGQWDGTALHWACWWGSRDAARLLLEKGLDIEDKKDAFGSSPLLWAAHGSVNAESAAGADYVGTVEMLIENGAAADTCNAEGIPAVSMASKRVAEILLQHGAKTRPTTRPAGLSV